MPATMLTPDAAGKAEFEQRCLAATYLVTMTPVWTVLTEMIDGEVPELARPSVKRVFAYLLCAVHGFGEEMRPNGGKIDISELDGEELGTYHDETKMLFHSIRTARQVLLKPFVRFTVLVAVRTLEDGGCNRGKIMDMQFQTLFDDFKVEAKIMKLLWAGYPDDTPQDTAKKFSATLLDLVQLAFDGKKIAGNLQ
uniref:ANTH domain-containing protein n=1 Tax=Panagrellus redivivus TaxID=6233 RepID=A0A7E4VUV4_PANRE